MIQYIDPEEELDQKSVNEEVMDDIDEVIANIKKHIFSQNHPEQFRDMKLSTRMVLLDELHKFLALKLKAIPAKGDKPKGVGTYEQRLAKHRKDRGLED